MFSKCPMRGVVHLIAKAESIIFCVSCLCFVISERCYAQLGIYMFMWFRCPLLSEGQDWTVHDLSSKVIAFRTLIELL